MSRRFDALTFGSAVALYILFYAAIFQQALLGNNYIAPSDSLDFGVSTYLSDASLWSEGMYSGYPVAGDPQTLTWYPVFQLFRVLDAPWNVFMIAAYVIASAAAFLLVRRLSGSTLAGLFGGLVYGFSGVMIAHISHYNQIHAAAWLPLVVYGLHLIREDRFRAGGAVTAAAYAMMWLAGHPQVAVYTFYLCAALVGGWLLIDRPDRPTLVQRVRWSAAGVVGGLGLAAVMIVPMLELGALSRRGAGRWDLYIQGALPPRQLLALLFPFSFGGILTPADVRVPYFGDNSPVQTTGYLGLIPLALAMVAAVRASAVRRDARLWLLLATMALLLCLGPFTPIGWIFYYVPGYAGFQLPARHFFLVACCAAVAAGFGFAQLTKPGGRRVDLASAIAVLLATGLVGGALLAWRNPAVRLLLETNHDYLNWALALPLGIGAILIVLALTGALIGPRSRIAGGILAVLLLMIHAVDMAVVHYMLPGYHFQYAEVPPEEVRPTTRIAALGVELRQRGQRILAVDGSRNPFLLPNLPRAWDVPAASGTGSLGVERYLDTLRMGGSGDVPDETFAPGHHALDLLGIRYVLVPVGSPLIASLQAQPERWQAIKDLQYSESDPDTKYTLFDNARARPRAWCAATAVAATAGQTLRAIRTSQLPDGGVFDPGRDVLVDGGDLSSLPSAPAGNANAATATVTSGSNQRYLVEAGAPCLLVVSNVYYPWWRASVDGEAVDVTRANHTLLTVPVPPGSHIVQFRLVPVTIWVGAAVTMLTALAGIVILRRPAW